MLRPSAFALLLGLPLPTLAAPVPTPFADYLRLESARLADHAFDGIQSRDDWTRQREARRQELLDMLGLSPLPPRTDLHPTVTGQLSGPGFVVEKLHFQSAPGLYVTANLYRPATVTGRLPAILYVCGHAPVKTNGLSCGNKTAYQHHGIWFARHGFVCLLVDTLQLGEIEGTHHGTHHLGQWWWNSRGYSPAGVETWNAIRALDYLQSRPDVDGSRLGLTGRSGGGSYTWTTAAVDDRIKVAAPVAGITDLQNQVVDGVVDGHCDCMFFVNTYRWDFGRVAALLAPRPLLFVNTDADSIFPLDGVLRVHQQVRRLYDLHGVPANLGLVIAPGPHKDTQDLQVPVFRWFARHLQDRDLVADEPALPQFPPLTLRVFDTLPTDERNTRAAEWFGPPTPRVAPLDDPATTLAQLRTRVFRGWPNLEEPPVRRELPASTFEGIRLRQWSIASQPGIDLPLLLLDRRAQAPRRVEVRVLGPGEFADWTGLTTERRATEFAAAGTRQGATDTALAILTVRGSGPAGSKTDPAALTRLRRRYQLLGQTLDGMRVWDIRRSLQALRPLVGGSAALTLTGSGETGVHLLYAALFEPGIARLRLRDLPASHRTGPDYLNVLQVTDLPQTLELARRQGIEVILD